MNEEKKLIKFKENDMKTILYTKCGPPEVLQLK